jgi:hypothetical protein
MRRRSAPTHRSHGAPDSDFARPQAHGVCDDAVEANGGEQQRQRSECAQQARADAGRCHRLGGDLGSGNILLEDDVRLEFPERLPQHRQGRDSRRRRPNHQPEAQSFAGRQVQVRPRLFSD